MRLRRAAVVALAVGLQFVPAAEAREKRVKLDALPTAVKATVLEASQGLKLRGLTQEVKNGATFYEAELEVDGRTRDVIIDATGAIVLIEEEVPWELLPAAVREAIEKGAAGGKILHVESLTRNHVIEAYEGHVRKGWRKIEIRVDPDGNPMVGK